jgi:hypothetical protein
MVLLLKFIDKNQEVQPFIIIYSKTNFEKHEWEQNYVFQEI